MNSIISKYKEIDKDRYSRFLGIGVIGLILLFLLAAFLKLNSTMKAADFLDEMAGFKAMKTVLLYINLARYTAILGFVALVLDWVAYNRERLYLDRIAAVVSVGMTAFVAFLIGGAVSFFSKAMNLGGVTDLDSLSLSSLSSVIRFAKSIYLMEFVAILMVITIVIIVYRLATGNILVLAESGVSLATSTEKETKVEEVKVVVKNTENNTQSVVTEEVEVKVELEVEEEPQTVEQLPQIKVNKKAFATVGAVIAVIVVGVFGYKFWDKNFNLTKVDLFENVVVEYYGTSPEGYADYDVRFSSTGNPVVDNFLDNVRFDFDKSSGLKNGDTINLSSRIDVETAKQNKLKVTEFTKEYTVEGLDEYLQTVDQMKNFSDVKRKLDNHTKVESEYVLGYYFTEDDYSDAPIIVKAYARKAYSFMSETVEFDQIRYVTMENLIVNPDGEVSGSTTTYGKSSEYLDEKMSLDQVKEHIKSYNYVEIKE